MRKVTYLFVVLILISAPAFGQLPNVRVPGDLWRVVFFGVGDPETEQVVTSLVADGYIPTGFEVEPGQTLGMLLVDRGEFEIDGWVINEYADFSVFEREFTAAISSGYVPMDISRFGNSISVLWVETDQIQIDGWRIHSTANTVDSRAAAINQFQEQGFSLWGFSAFRDQAWFLFLNSPQSNMFGVVSAFPKIDEALRDGILQANTNGFLPNGLGISGDSFFVSMTRG
jgi:hypothetical protein